MTKTRAMMRCGGLTKRAEARFPSVRLCIQRPIHPLQWSNGPPDRQHDRYQAGELDDQLTRGGRTMTPEEQTELVKKHYALNASGDYAAAADLLTDDFV